MKKNIILSVIITLLFLSSCQNYESIAPDTFVDKHIYENSVLDYLSGKGITDPIYTFDSMLVIINEIPELSQLLKQSKGGITVFAVPDKCFESSFDQLNTYRAQKDYGEEISLQDLLIEPFTIIDSIFEVKPGIEPGTELVDTIVNYYHYDYKAQLDSLFRRYIFEGWYDSDTVLNSDQQRLTLESYGTKYRMNMSSKTLSSSGVVDGGMKTFVFSDMNESQLVDRWESTDIEHYDIYANDGVIHIITDQHNFSFGKFVNYFKNRGNEEIEKE